MPVVELSGRNPRLPLVLRPGVPEDLAFIVDSWVMSFRGQAIARDAGRGYMRDMKWLVRRLLEQCAILVAADEDEPGAIWGWAATRGNAILYVFVRREFRRQGIAKRLLAPYLTKPTVIYAAKTNDRIPIPEHWTYSFLTAIRIAIGD